MCRCGDVQMCRCGDVDMRGCRYAGADMRVRMIRRCTPYYVVLALKGRNTSAQGKALCIKIMNFIALKGRYIGLPPGYVARWTVTHR
jgi:hypothetical protein